MVGARGERLHDEHVLPGQQGRLGELEVRERRRGDHDEIEVGRLEDLLAAIGDGGDPVLGADARRPLEAGVAYGLHLAAGVAREVAYQVGPPVAAPHYADPHGFAPPLHAARPELNSTTGIVFTRIWRSSHSDQRRTYSTSSSHICRKLTRLRPDTCHKPVIPGFTCSRSNCQ